MSGILKSISEKWKFRSGRERTNKLIEEIKLLKEYRNEKYPWYKELVEKAEKDFEDWKTQRDQKAKKSA